MFWHSVWISAGRPINTELHRIMKRSRNAYHFQIRKNKKLAENLKKNAFLNACINNNEDIFKLIRKERATTTSVPTTMDGVSMDIENQYINRANELNQEFYFADMLTRIKINNIFNMSFYWSQIWDLFNQESERVEKTWNTLQRV